jgi:glyoxylase-like metal-dependent hydrolase (beta-lactamase superfamily II)
MTIHIFNGFTDNARFPRHWECGTIELLIETNDGLALVDTGLGTQDYVHDSGILKMFKVITRMPLDPNEAAIHQVTRLGYKPEDVRHIVLTHMHFDHCGGLPDFPWAKVHVYHKEYEAFLGKRQQFNELAYVRRHIAHGPDWVVYEDSGGKWFDFDAIRLPFEPEMWLVPLVDPDGAGPTPGADQAICGCPP